MTEHRGDCHLSKSEIIYEAAKMTGAKLHRITAASVHNFAWEFNSNNLLMILRNAVKQKCDCHVRHFLTWNMNRRQIRLGILAFVDIIDGNNRNITFYLAAFFF